MKLANLINSNFLEALERLRAQKLSMKAAFALSGLSKKVREEISKFEEARKNSLEKLCDRDESGNPVMDGNNFKLSPEAMSQLAQELSEVAALEVDLKKIKLKDLGDLSNVEMSTLDFEVLECIFDQED